VRCQLPDRTATLRLFAKQRRCIASLPAYALGAFRADSRFAEKVFDHSERTPKRNFMARASPAMSFAMPSQHET
jgi:hypothetical protein